MTKRQDTDRSGPEKARLTKRVVDALTAREKAFRVWDADCSGFHVQVQPSGVKTFYLQTRTKAGRGIKPKIGRADRITADQARKAAEKMLAQIELGGDPSAELEAKRDAQKASREQPSDLFEQIAADFRKRHVDKTSPKTATMYNAYLKLFEARWRGRRLAEIGRPDVLDVLDDLVDAGKPIAANRAHATIRKLFAWALERGLLATSPITGLRAPAQERARERAFRADEIAALWHGAARLEPAEAAYLRVMLLTGKRKSALAAMRESEIGADGWWRPPQPATRETKLNLSLPLAAPVLRIIRATPRRDGNPYVFTGRHGHLDPGSSLQAKVRRASGIDDFGWHACRHTVATGLEELRVPGNAARRFTDHAQPRDAHQRYIHASLEDEAADAADTWARYVQLVISRHIWPHVRDYLAAEDIANGERSAIRRARKREFCALIQAGGEPWVRWVRGIARPAAGRVVRLRRASSD